MASPLAARAGLRPGILTRGYGGSARDWPRQVLPGSDPAELGDEPVLLARRSGCPVVAGPDRPADADRLVRALGCDILVSDDGLQHYRLGRRLEIAVIDGARGLGNGRCLPAGPLREPPGRLAEVDLILCTLGTAGVAPAESPALRVPTPCTWSPGPRSTWRTPG